MRLNQTTFWPVLTAAIVLGGPPFATSTKAAEPDNNPEAAAPTIDRLIEERLNKEAIPLSPPADDAEFLRRATLDIAGRIPMYDEVVSFLNDGDSSKRERLIERLLADPRSARSSQSTTRKKSSPTTGRSALSIKTSV